MYRREQEIREAVLIEIILEYLFCSTIQEWSALQESPRTWGRKKTAII